MLRIIVVLSILCLVSAEKPDSRNRIVGGRNSRIVEFPYQVSIQNWMGHYCGGSIIAPEWILTAAHCLLAVIRDGNYGALEVRAGSSVSNSGGVMKQIAIAYNHPDYIDISKKYDVGLIKLQGPLTYSASIKPIKLLKDPINTGEPLVVSGWGQLNESNWRYPLDLQSANVKYVSRDDCSSSQYSYGTSVMDSMVCATAPNKDACQGDSGGPLAIQGKKIQVGVVSWGTGCGEERYPGVYSDVTDPKIFAFIKQHVPSVILSYY